MNAVGFWPVAVVPVGRVACATTLWRTRGRLHVTVVVKSRYRLVPDGTMTAMLPEPVRPQQGELAPYLAQADVVISAAHAYAPAEALHSAIAARLALFYQWAVIDKSLLVYPRGDDAGPTNELVTNKLALVSSRNKERTGIVVNPSDPKQPGTFGPMAATAPERRALLKDGEPRIVEGVVELPDMFPWAYYQVAPPDQRTTHLKGDEWVVLDGMHESLPRLQSQLPGGFAQVRIYPPGLEAGSCYQVEMQSDQLFIDVDRMECSILRRGSFPVADVASARALTLVATIDLPGHPAYWPTREQLLRSPVLRAHGLVGAPGESLSDSLSLSWTDEPTVIEDEPETAVRLRSDTVEAAMQEAERRYRAERPTLGASRRATLSITSEGVVELDPVSASSARVPASQAQQTSTVGRCPNTGSGARAACGLPPPNESRALRPLRVAGAPWTEQASAERADGENTEVSEAPDLAEATVDDLEAELASTLDEVGVNNIEELAEMSWRHSAGDPKDT